MTATQPTRREKSRHPVLFAALAGLWTTILLAGLLLPGDSLAGLETDLVPWLSRIWPLQLEIPNPDKFFHALLFAGETLFLCLWWRAARQARPLAAALLVAILLACFTELAQLAIPRRTGDWADLAANYAGILLSALLIFFSSQPKKRGLHP